MLWGLILFIAVMILSSRGLIFQRRVSRSVFGGCRSRSSTSKHHCAPQSVAEATADGKVVIPSGLVAIFKPIGWSSNDVVAKIRNELRVGARKESNGGRCKIKVGHGGTLDPLAEGVLVVGVGSGTKLMGDYLKGAKSYSAEALLGTEMDTLDSTGKVTETVDSSHITYSSLEEALPTYTGDIMQIPPMFSALKKDGKRLYSLAREGIVVEREPRPVTISHLKLAHRGKGDASDGLFGLDVSCSGGTYIRTLISDLARTCGGRAHMTALVRTRQGPYISDDCLYQEDWEYGRIIQGIKTCSEKAGIDWREQRPAAAVEVEVEVEMEVVP